jgi:UDP-glucose 4-epimerase
MLRNAVKPFQGKHVLVTGGLGFIGGNLVRRLVPSGAHVCVVDSLDPSFGGNPYNLDGVKDRVQIKIADLRQSGLIEELIGGQDYLFNLAGQVSHLDSMLDPLTDFQINAGLQLAIVEACRKYNPSIKIVFAGTRQIYGRAQYLPVDEEHPVSPVDYNGVTKRAGEMYQMVAHRVYGLRVASLRMTNVYGPRMRVRDNRQTFLAWWIRNLLTSQPIQVFGDGRQIRDLNYIDDVVDALLLAAASPVADGKIYNLGSDEPICLLDLARLMIEVWGEGCCELQPFPPDRKRIDIGDYHGNYAKISRELGWRPTTRLKEGLACTLDYFSANFAHYA